MLLSCNTINPIQTQDKSSILINESLAVELTQDSDFILSDMELDDFNEQIIPNFDFNNFKKRLLSGN